ncbi:MAG: NifX-associated nitrogen fixation protein [Ancalomicrobiaceae bacterium]|nr:NifX-associated nitrogen fixation protein [Ancalomicrobiaceae bacterium]
MTAAIAEAPVAGIDHPFVKALTRVIRAEDSYGSWEKLSDAEVLKDYIVTKEQRREIPIIDDPDPDILWRVEKFYSAVAIAIEQATGRMASPMMKMSHEGFGRVILTAGRLVVVVKSLRDVHRFGFDDFAKLGEAGQKLVDEATSMIAEFPQVADT